MQIFPLTSDAVAATPDHGVVPTPAEPLRTFCVVWRTGGPEGPLWKADVVADDPLQAVWAVVYDRSISTEQVVGVIDRSTIR